MIQFLKKYILILLFGTTVFLLLVDIGVRLWFGLRLEFDSNNFSNIVTPITTVISAIAFLVLAFTQNSMIVKQNQIIHSQNLRPYFEKEIDRIIEKSKAKSFAIRFKEKSSLELPDILNQYTPFNFRELIDDTIRKLIHNTHFLEDAERSKVNNVFDPDYLIKRGYYDKVIFLSEFTEGLGNRFEYDTVKNLLLEIEDSKLIPEEQIQLKRRIKRELLQDYLSSVSWYSNQITPPIPDLVVGSGKAHYEFIHLGKTRFSEHYEWFKEHLPSD